MVQLDLKIRPQRGYTLSGSIKKVSVDSSTRLEELLKLAKGLNKKGTILYHNGIELPLNSSLATHNVPNGDIIETCSSPIISTILSAVISDIEAVQKLSDDDRDREDLLAPLLDNPSSFLPDDWNRWSFDDTKRRAICCKMLKQVIQRNGRFADFQSPPCKTLHDLYDFVVSAEVFTANKQRSNMSQAFKPSAVNRGGEPSLCWALLEEKLTKFHNHRFDNNNNDDDDDKIESFVKSEEKRHLKKGSAVFAAASSSIHTPTRNNNPIPIRKRRCIPISSSHSLQQRKCTTCLRANADSICLSHGCPFQNQVCCKMCFQANHPILHRNHELVSLDDRRAKAVLKQKDRIYCPEYASGPFAILTTLYEQQQQKNNVLSLNEGNLKELAQARCRSNLYDRQARGRSAFSCIEKLADEYYLRKESIPGEPEDRAKYSLLPKGEKIAKVCLKFERAVEMNIRNHNMIRDKSQSSESDRTTCRLVIDSREDQLFAKRLKNICRSKRIPCLEKELPAGDYLFVTPDDNVLPLIIERKTWSDLADSVSGRATRERRRLECVRIDGSNESGECILSKCQLCRMKASGCSLIMFVIEGGRCLNRDDQPSKCTPEKLCKYCLDLHERHHIIQPQLENILYTLQTKHGCLVHFTRDYNDTARCLLQIRHILSRKSTNLTYNQFCSNARRRNNTGIPYHVATKGRIIEWDADTFVQKIHRGEMRKSLFDAFGGKNSNGNKVADGQKKYQSVSIVDNQRRGNKESEIIMVYDSDEERKEASSSEDEIQIINESRSTQSTVDDDIIVLEDFSAPARKRKHDDEFCEVIEHLSSPPAKKKRRRNDVLSNEVEIIDEVVTAQKVASTKHPGTLLADKYTDQSKRKLLLLTGVYDYDTDFYSDLNKIWKLEFSNPSQDFSQHINQMQNPPFVEREYIHYWLLYLQINFNCIVHMARWNQCTEDVKSFWNDCNQTRNRILPVRLDMTPTRTTNPVSTRLKEPPQQQPISRKRECIICLVELGTENVEATPCGHTLHTACLRRWMSASKSCPVCNHYIGDAISNVPSLPVQNTTSIQRVTATIDDGIRNARLRRFENNSQSTERMQQQQNWKCTNCTFENTQNVAICQMCNQRKTITSPKQERRENISSQKDQEWTCFQCTLKNNIYVKKCNACGASNPFILDTVDIPTNKQQSSGIQRNRELAHHPKHISQIGATTTTTAKAPLAVSTPSKKMRCGACGQEGHNRGNYTPGVCPKYYDPKEVEFRQRKKEREEEKKRSAQRRIEELEDSRDSSNAKMLELQRMLAVIQRDRAVETSATESELKRLRREKARAEKNAQKYG